jgi:hypothetical protein
MVVADVSSSGRFKPSVVKEIIAGVLNEQLAGKEFSVDNTSGWTKEISDEIKKRLKGANSLPIISPGRRCLDGAATRCSSLMCYDCAREQPWSWIGTSLLYKW